MACYDGNKRSLEEDSFTAGTELSSCALAMMARERESLPSPSESPGGAFSNSVSNTSSSLQTAELTQGYDVEFDPPLERKYECPICLMALRNAIQTPCGHRFCKNCIKKSIRDTGQRCPVDNAMLLEDQLFLDNFANREILSLTVRCPNTGCINKMELRQLENHLKQCEFATAECPQCQHSVMKSDLENHKTLECLRRPVSCPDCVACFVYEEKELHEQQCPFANIKCQYCDLDLIRDQMESHCETDCPKAPIMCNFSDFGCKERMQRHDLAQHMQEFTQMHMRYIADFLSGLNLSSTAPRSLRALGSSLSCEDQGAASVPAFRQSISCNSNCAVGQQSQEMLRIREMDARLVKQDHQLRELIIVKDNQAGQLAELQRKVSALEETVKELEAQQCHGVFIWPLKSFSALLRNQEAGHPVVEHSPGFYTGHPGYKLCLRLHLQTPNAPRCSNFISLFVHTMQGAFDGLLTWPFQGTIRLAILDQGPEGQHHMEVMETNPELQAFQKPTMYRNNKGFGYVTFLNLHQLSQRAFVKDDTLLIRCEVTPRFDNMFHREGPAMQPRGPEVKLLNFELPN